MSQYAPLPVTGSRFRVPPTMDDLDRDDVFLQPKIQSLHTATEHIKSTKVNERKKGAENVINLMDDDQYNVLLKYLDSNSTKEPNPDYINWTSLFNDVQTYFSRETEKLDPKDVKDKKKAAAISLVQKVFKKATSRHPYIQKDAIYTFIKQRLEKQDFVIVYGFSLFGMLQHYLSFQEYQNEMTSDDWIDLITILKKLYKDAKGHSIPKLNILETLNTAIVLACNLTRNIRYIRKIFLSAYKEGLSNQHGKEFGVFLSGFTTFCKLNAIEIREILCSTGEELIPRAFINSVVSLEDEDEELILEMFLVQIQLHSPFDSVFGSDGFYAQDSKGWADCILHMFNFCYDITQDVAKKRNNEFKSKSKLSPLLLQVFAKCTNQIHYLNANLLEGDEGGPSNPPKRQMTHLTFQAILEDTCKGVSGSEKQLVWITYITAILDQFPHLINGKQNLALLSTTGMTLLSVSSGRSEVYSFFSALLHTEKSLIHSGVLAQRIVNWDFVWESTIKSFAQNQETLEGLELLRLLLIETQPASLNPLLSIYAHGSISLSQASVDLLIEYLSQCTLPSSINSGGSLNDGGTCPRSALIKWIITSLDKYPQGEDSPIATDCGAIISALLVKRSYLIMRVFKRAKLPLKSIELTREPFEVELLASTFSGEGNSEAPEPEVEEKRAILEESGVFVPVDNIGGILIELLKGGGEEEFKNLYTLDRKSNWGETLKKLGCIQQRLSLLLTLLDSFEKFELEVDLACSLNELEILFDETFAALSDGIELIRRTRPVQMDHILAIVKYVQNFFKYKPMNLSRRLKAHLSSKIPQPLHENLKHMFLSSLGKYTERYGGEFGFLMTQKPSPKIIEGFKGNRAAGELKPGQLLDKEKPSSKLSIQQKCQHIATTALSSLLEYGLITESPLEYLQNNICSELCAQMTLSKPLYLFHMAQAVMSRLIPELPSSPGLINSLILLLQSMCRVYHKNMECNAKLWTIFGSLSKYMHLYFGPEYQDLPHRYLHKYMILVRSLSSKSEENNKINLLIARLNCLKEISVHDPELTWSWYVPLARPGTLNQTMSVHSQSSTDRIYTILDNFEFLNSPSHRVRLASSEQIISVFSNASPTASREIVAKRNQFHKEVSNVIQTLLQIPSNLPQEEIEQENKNRWATVLLLLTRLIFSNPYLEKKAIFHLLLIYKGHNIDVELTNRALKRASPSALLSLTSHIEYIIEKWIKSYPISEFPFILLDCSSIQEFYERFRREITVQFFEQVKIEPLNEFAKSLGHSSSLPLIQESYGELISRMLPFLSTGPTIITPDTSPTKQFNYMKASYGRLTKILGGSDEENILKMKKCGDLYISIISTLYEVNIGHAKWGCSQLIRLPDPEPFYSGEESIVKSIKYLDQGLGKRVIPYLIEKKPGEVHRILLTLLLRIHRAHDELERIWRLHQYSFFIKLLLEEGSTHLLPFISSFVTHSYIRLLSGGGLRTRSKREKLEFTQGVLFLLNEFIQRLGGVSTQELEVHFQPIVNKLLELTIKEPLLFLCISTTLDFLILDNDVTFAKCISTLSPFPKHINGLADEHQDHIQKYQRMHLEKKYGLRSEEWSLRRELKSCNEDLEKTGFIRVSKERLQFICELLGGRKGELKDLVKEMEEKRMSVEFKEDPLHNLIQHLLNICMSSKDKELVHEANRCLGEIGPIDLSVQVMPSLNTSTSIRSTDPQTLYPTLTKMVLGFLEADDIQLVQTAGQVLGSLMEDREFANIVNRMEEDESRMGALLAPFKGVQTKVFTPRKIKMEALETHFNEVLGSENESWSEWMIKLTTGLIKTIDPSGSIPSRLLPLCLLNADFCKEILPFVIHSILSFGKGSPLIRKLFTSYFKRLFEKVNKTATTNSSQEFGAGGSIYLNKMSIRSHLDVVQFLRLHQIPKEYKGNQPLTAWDNNFWLDFDYFELAKAAQYCGAYLTSILFAEIFASERGGSKGLSNGSTEDDGMEGDGEFYSQNTTFYPKNVTAAKMIEKLLLKAYISIGEEDATFGCGSARFSDFQSSIEYLQQQKQWGRVISTFDSATNEEGSQALGICTSFKEMGLYNTLWTYLRGSMSSVGQNGGEDLSEIQYECGWRLSKWDLNTNDSNYIVREGEGVQNEHAAFHKHIYEALHSGLIEDNRIHLRESISRAFQNIVLNLRDASLESSQNLYGFLSRFQHVRIVEDFFSLGIHSLDEYLSKWREQALIPTPDFKFLEPILFAKNVLLQGRETLSSNGYAESLLELLVQAREGGHLELAENMVTKIHGLKLPDFEERVKLESAKNNWVRGEGQREVAKHLLGKLIKVHVPETSPTYPGLLLLYGEWLIESMSERPTVILDKYLRNSINIYEKMGNRANVGEVAKAHIILAKYADSQYQSVSKYMTSDLFREKKEHLERAKNELSNTIPNIGNQNQILQKSSILLKKQTTLDQSEIDGIVKEKQEFLNTALRHYLRGLLKTNEYDLLIFRAISLWLENSGEKDDVTTSIVAAETKNMPSYKYIPVLHQLSARMGGSNSGIEKQLTKILGICAKEHPYHTLPVLLTQALLNLESKGKRSGGGSSSDRVKAAEKIINFFKKNKDDRELGELVRKMEELWIALITLANFNGKVDDKEKRIGINSKQPIRNLHNLEKVPIPTLDVAISPTKNYKNKIIGIKSFEFTYAFVGGINSPKRITCTGTNGIQYNMLLKGNDDIRQDAVMMKVFAVCNQLLKKEPSTRARKLQIRTYNCVPLCQNCGIIEWCENTVTLGEYLVGDDMNSGAHQRFRPMDDSPGVCRTAMNKNKDSRDNGLKLETFKKIMDRFKPVFRHFFFENFLDAGTFFERRLAYTRSVATSSMVGYILGLGDRHVMNILLDKSTAEFIHIDLGVAFDQGRVLPTPELIPFRLTRDLVDGMGVAGIEGVFRRSCEMTLEVLRNNAEIILTILEVLLYDPLYMWTLTADQMAKVQPLDSSSRKRGSLLLMVDDPPAERNNSAGRVLLRLKQKLMGLDEGGSSGSTVNVPGQVSLLIQRAMDNEKLCRLFPGWQPYL